MIRLDELRRDVPWFPEAVRTAAPDFGDGEFYAHVQGYDPNSDALYVSLELPDDSPAVQDVVADGGSAEQAEFIAIVPRVGAEAASLNSEPGLVDDPRPDLRAAHLAAVEEAERVERTERVARIQDEMLSGKRARPFPELRA